MKVHELIEQLQAKPRNATVYVQAIDPETGQPLLVAVERVDPAQSPAYGTAVVIETEACDA